MKNKPRSDVINGNHGASIRYRVVAAYDFRKTNWTVVFQGYQSQISSTKWACTFAKKKKTFFLYGTTQLCSTKKLFSLLLVLLIVSAFTPWENTARFHDKFTYSIECYFRQCWRAFRRKLCLMRQYQRKMLYLFIKCWVHYSSIPVFNIQLWDFSAMLKPISLKVFVRFFAVCFQWVEV